MNTLLLQICPSVKKVPPNHEKARSAAPFYSVSSPKYQHFPATTRFLRSAMARRAPLLGWHHSDHSKHKETATQNDDPNPKSYKYLPLLTMPRLPRPSTPPGVPPSDAYRAKSKLSFGVVCSSNINRSMEAHVVLGNAGDSSMDKRDLTRFS